MNHLISTYTHDAPGTPYRLCHDGGWYWDDTFCGAPTHPHVGPCAPDPALPYCATSPWHDGPCEPLQDPPETRGEFLLSEGWGQP